MSGAQGAPQIDIVALAQALAASLRCIRPVFFEHTKAHVEHPWNELADRMCEAARHEQLFVADQAYLAEAVLSHRASLPWMEVHFWSPQQRSQYPYIALGNSTMHVADARGFPLQLPAEVVSRWADVLAKLGARLGRLSSSEFRRLKAQADLVAQLVSHVGK